jgi:hypothetical protein
MAEMKFMYRKFGDFYYVSELHTYNPITETYQSDSVGTVRKVGREWVGKPNTGGTVKAKTRHAASVAMLQQIEQK